MSNILKYFCIITSLGGAIALICKAIHSQDILCLILGVLLIICCCIITKCPTDDEDVVLRPMSSMTQEDELELIDKGLGYYVNGHEFRFVKKPELIDWLNKHHFDYRGLIEKGLAIEVTEDNNPYVED